MLVLSICLTGTLDPHASTSALLNNKKVGINILVTGQFSVKVAAEVLLESVFAFVHHTGRPASTDVPILMAHSKFAHSMEMVWDKRPIQCDYKFIPGMMKEDSITLINSEGKASKDILRSGYHKVQLQGLITSQVLPHVMKYLYQLAQSHTTTINPDTTTNTTTNQRKLAISSAYSYLKHGDTSNNKNTPAHTDMRNVPGAVAASMVTVQPRQAPQLPPVNPMILVTTKARVYAAPKEEKEGDGSESDGDGDGDSGNDREEEKDTKNSDRKDGERKDELSAELSNGKDATAGNSATKRKLETNSPRHSAPSSNIKPVATSAVAGVTNSTFNTTNTPVALQSSGELRAEKWLKQRRDSSLPYFLIQLSTVAPRCTQLSYAHLAACQSIIELDAQHSDVLLQAEPLIEEIRWQADAHSREKKSIGVVKAIVNENVEVVTTTQPTLRTKILESAKSKNSASEGPSDQDHDELEENGVLLDALNKYSIFVESKPM